MEAALASWGGELDADVGNLASADFPALATVGGDVTVQALQPAAAIGSVSMPAAVEVRGAVRVGGADLHAGSIANFRLFNRALTSDEIYQLYAYLRSQVERGDPWADIASGLLLHPAINGSFDESVVIQGHKMQFATVNLAGSHEEIKERLLTLVIA